MVNQRPHNKTLALTTLLQAAKSYCTTPVGTLTALNQLEQYQSLNGLQTECDFNGILGALHINSGGHAGEHPFL